MGNMGVPEPAAPAIASNPSQVQRPLRLWPGVVMVVIMWAAILGPAILAPGTFAKFIGLISGPIVGLLGIAIWWLFASRLRWAERWLGLFTLAIGGAVASLLVHPSFGWMGVIMSGLPWALTAWVGWLVVFGRATVPVRRFGLVVSILLGWSYCTLLRLEGVDGSFSADLPWRWAPTAEEKFLAEIADRRPVETLASAEGPALKLASGDWPGFRGPNRDAHLPGIRIQTDWKAHPPRQVWRHRVGPGWGSFAVIGNRLYTQEQRGKSEGVICYDANTGAELWVHLDPARFTETVSGPGPRATPTFDGGKIYSLGGEGLLNCLDAATGKKIWSHDTQEEAKKTTKPGEQTPHQTVPIWGFAASPLIVQGIVSVYIGGEEGKAVAGYKADSGKLAWLAGNGELGYSSTQLARIGGEEQLLIVTDAGLMSLQPTEGTVLWKHDWSTTKEQIVRCTQPTVIGNDVLIGTGFHIGTRRVNVSRGEKDWQVNEGWTTKAIKPYFNDLVVQAGFIYGFDSVFFTCVGLDDGKERWRARKYANGQSLLLEDQKLLLILTEGGDVALLEANPQKQVELARLKVFDSKTWNHPVIAHGKLFVRNGEEAACFELAEEYTQIAEK
jgi:outer membrane protein assembly factor BamB